MKIYKYKDRAIIEFDDKTRLSLATKKYGETLNQIIEQIKETSYKLGNAYNIIDEDTVEILYWSNKDNKIIPILVDYDIWFKYKEITWTLNVNGYAHGWFTEVNGRMFLHRLAMGLGKDYSTDNIVDHINGNKLDNRRSNLRITDSEGNAKNKPYYNKDSEVGIRGISYTKNKRTGNITGYRVRWCINKKEHQKTFRLDQFEEAVKFNELIREENGHIIRRGEK